jgi:hypothetical protein
MVRAATQILVGLMLFFATATLIPRAVAYLKFGRKGKGLLYLFLGIAAAIFSVVAFGYAYTVLTGSY